MNVYIRRYKDNYHWFSTSEQQLIASYQGTLQELATFYTENVAVKNWVLIAPALDTASRVISFTEKERKHIGKAIPFLLEDDLLTEATELHYVAGKPVDKRIQVVAVDKAILTAWLQELASAGIRPTHCLPETQLLLEPSCEWQIYYRQQEYILRTSDGQCAAFEEEHFPLSIELITEKYARLPQSIELIADDEASLEEAWVHIPEAIKPLIETKILSYAEMLEQRFSQQVKIWNLLKGQFAYTQQWLSALMPWRWLAVSLVVVMVLHVAMLFTEYRQFKNQNLRLRAEMETLFRQAIPKGQIVDHRKQLEHELETLQHGGGGNFMPKIQRIGEVFAKYQVNTLNALNFEQSKGEIRIDLIIDNYEKLQQVIDDLKQAGLNTDIQNSNAQGEQLRARIRITG